MIEKLGTVKFMEQYASWYKGITNDMNVFLSLPNELNSGLFKLGNNPVYIDLFEKKNQDIDAKQYMNELLEMADANGVSLYLEPIPRYKYITDDGKKEKITRQYLMKYFSDFGFKKIDFDWMERN